MRRRYGITAIQIIYKFNKNNNLWQQKSDCREEATKVTPRDGKFIEKIGTYNPNTNPATVDLNFERALYWVNVGAQPTDTARNILSREGVYLMKHLQGGVKKGAFDEAAAQAKFDAWKQAKESALKAITVKDEQAKREQSKAKLEAEKKVNEAIAEKVATKKAEAKAAADAAAAEAAAQEAAAEATEAPAEEAAPAEA